MQSHPTTPLIAIACGGTGGHLFPGIAVAEELLRRDCDVMLLISPKEVDQQAVRAVHGMEIVTLPAVGLTRGGAAGFISGCWKSHAMAKRMFRKRAPRAVLAMGGFTSAPPVLAGRSLGAKAFLHESNTIPGRANRWLSHVVHEAFVYFDETSARLSHQNVQCVGMPVRPQFLETVDAGAARLSFGLKPDKPVLLIMGGSQGASGINELIIKALPALARQTPELQFIHLTGSRDFESVRAAYAGENRDAVVRPFLTEMELALGAATLAVSRSGASSIAELAAMRVPAVLVPFPAATDNHQHYNALALVKSGAAKLVEQRNAGPKTFSDEIATLLQNGAAREAMQHALGSWHKPDAAERIARRILAWIDIGRPSEGGRIEDRAAEAVSA